MGTKPKTTKPKAKTKTKKKTEKKAAAAAKARAAAELAAHQPQTGPRRYAGALHGSISEVANQPAPKPKRNCWHGADCKRPNCHFVHPGREPTVNANGGD